MTIRGKLVSVLLFLGLFMVVPLGFSLLDLAEIQAEIDALSARGPGGDVEVPHDLPPDVVLAEEALKVLTDVLVRARRFGGKPSESEGKKLQRTLERFERLWGAFPATEAGALAEIEGLGEVLGLGESGGDEDWKRVHEALERHDPASWGLDPKQLRQGVTSLLGAEAEKQRSQVFRQLRKVATGFRKRLLQVSQKDLAVSGEGEGAASARVVGAQVESATRIFLEELREIKQREITRVGFLVAVGGILALFFARVLWQDLLAPLERLRVSINNMAMSGTPTRVDTRGPQEVADLLQAYNRLIDMIAAEGQGPETVPCSRCSAQFEKGSKYCPACGFPV